MAQNEQVKQTVYTPESQEYYFAIMNYWTAVDECGETSDEATRAGMRMLAEEVLAKQAGADNAELISLRVHAKWTALDGRR
jgi:hypothetical protein